MKDKLIEFIRDEFLDDPDVEITEQTKLISSGLIDSFPRLPSSLYRKGIWQKDTCSQNHC